MGKDVAVIIAGRFLQALLGIAALRIMTAVLSPAQVGNYYLILSFCSGFGLFLINPVGMYINRKIHAWHAAKTITDRFFVFNVYVLLVSAAAVALTFTSKKLLGTGSGLPDLSFAVIVAAYVYCSTWNMTLVPALNMLGHRVPFVIFSVLTIALGLAFSVLTVFNISATAFSWLSGQIVAMLLISFAALYALQKKIGGSFKGIKVLYTDINMQAFKGVTAYAVPLAGGTLFMWLQTQGYRLIVEMKAGAEFLGYLAVGLGISSGLAALCESLVQQIYLPGFYKKISAGSQEDRKNALAELAEKTIPVYVILVFFTVALASQLTGLLVDPRFHGAAKFVAFGAFVEFFRMAANIIASAAHSEMKTKTLIKPYAAGGMVTCAAVYLASIFPFRETFIPLSLALGGMAALFFMRRETARIMRFDLNMRLLFKTSGYACPLLLFLALRNIVSPVRAVPILLAAGAYFVFLQYMVAFRWGKTGFSSALWKKQPSAATSTASSTDYTD